MKKIWIGSYEATIRYDDELAMWRGEFAGLNGGADFYAADLDALQEEGTKSLKVFLDVCREQGIEPEKPSLKKAPIDKLQIAASP